MSKKIIFWSIVITIGIAGLLSYFGVLPITLRKKQLIFYLERLDNLTPFHRERPNQDNSPKMLYDSDKIASLLEIPGYSIELKQLYALSSNLSQEIVTNLENPIVGVTTYFYFDRLLKNGLKVESIFEISPSLETNCKRSGALVTHESHGIQTTNDLNGKSIGVEQGSQTSADIFKEFFINKNVKLKNAYLNLNKEDLQNGLIKNQQIQAAVIQTFEYDNKKVSSSFGTIVNGKFENNPDVKILGYSNFVTPCYVAFTFKDLDEKFKTHLKKSLKAKFSEIKNRKEINSQLEYIGSLHDFTDDEKLHNEITKFYQYNLRNFSENVHLSF